MGLVVVAGVAFDAAFFFPFLSRGGFDILEGGVGRGRGSGPQ